MGDKTKQGGYTLNHSKTKKHAEILLYGYVGGWNFSFDKVVNEVDNYGELDTVELKINTIGGNFYHGLAIYNFVKQLKAHVTVNIIGYALSMGSLAIFAADKVVMAQNALIMIHRAQGYAGGDADALRRSADRLEIHEEAILPDFQHKLSMTAEEVMTLLKNETWYTAKRALDAGLIDEITDPINLEKATQQIDENSWKECMGDQCTMPDENRIIIDNVFSPPPEPKKFTLFEKVFGEKPEPEQEDIEMTPDELKAILAENNKKIEEGFDKKLADFKAKLTVKEEPAEETETTETDKTKVHADEVAALQEKLDAAEAETAELKKPAHGTTVIPENTGNAEDQEPEVFT